MLFVTWDGIETRLHEQTLYDDLSRSSTYFHMQANTAKCSCTITYVWPQQATLSIYVVWRMHAHFSPNKRL